MNIGELAKTTGVGSKTIRYYEAEGLIPQPMRTHAGYRIYRQGDVQRLFFIKRPSG